MVDIAKKHGLSIGYQSGRRIQTKSIQDYQRDRQKERDDALKAREAWVGRKEEELTEYEEVLERRETIVENRNQTIENKRAIVNEQLDKAKERIATEDTKLTERAKGLDAREGELEEREKILQTEAEESVKQVQQAVSAAIDSVKPSPGKQIAEYPTVPLKKGYRAVPEKELEVYIDRSWYRPEYIKKTMQEVVNKFNELPFVKAAYKGFGDTNTEATDMMYSAVGVKVPASCGIEGHYKGDNRGTHGIPTTDCDQGHRYTCECVNLVVPKGGSYRMATAVNGKSVYDAGEALPNHYTPRQFDTYIYGDYIYKYNYIRKAGFLQENPAFFRYRKYTKKQRRYRQ